MSAPNVTGYAALAAGAQLEPFNYPSPELGEYDVRVDITHCGICHSDIQAIDDYYGITSYPLVPGHEIVGHVSAVGRGVSALKEGDRVGIGWQARSCGHCEWCLNGREQLCMDIADCGVYTPHGGFASSVVADHRFAYPLPDAMPAELAAVLMCAGVTVYSPLRAFAGASARSLGIVGVGGLGHLAIQFAHAFGYEVTAISSTAEKQAQALAFGADHFLVSEPSTLKQANYRFDMLLCTAPGKFEWDPLLMTVKKAGKLVLVGFPDVAFNSTDLVAHELSIMTSFLGTHADMRDMLSFAQSHNIKAAVELMPMTQVNEALQRLRDNKARYRIVLAN